MDIPPEDVEELPNLGSRFNDEWVWRHHVKLLQVGKASPS